MNLTVLRTVCLVFLSSISSPVLAGFDIIQDGRQFRCEEQQINPGSSADCANKAYNGPYSREESIALCAGARNNAPADCAIKAYNGPFNKETAVELCKGARTTGPALCAEKAYNGPFSQEEAVRICKSNGDELRAECAIKAYNGPYSKDEAVQLCTSGNEGLLIRSFMLMEQSADMKARIIDIKAKTQKKPKLTLPLEI